MKTRNEFKLTLILLITGLIFGVLALTNLAAQSEIYQGVNTITIKTTENQSDTHLKWGQHLVQNGFEIANNDKDFFTIRTEPKDFSRNNCNCEYYIFSVITDEGIKSKIKLKFKTTGMDLVDPGIKYPYYAWEYRDKKKNPGYTLYQEMAPIFNSFGNNEIIYSIN